jgi:exonuclease SbcD
MKILHTSDWHLGRNLYHQKRYQEHELFLKWLLETIEQNNIDILLVCGDIFDTGTPSNRSLQMYYRFLCDVSSTCCSHVVITAGNHDSPSLLNAPKEVLKHLNVHVIPKRMENPQDEVLELENPSGEKVIVAAIPYLGDKDIRKADAGESIQDKEQKLTEGIKSHYKEILKLAMDINSNKDPLIVTGHLLTSGAKTIEGDGVRDLYIGNLGNLQADDLFPDTIDYAALGHIHKAQKIQSKDYIRYCGAPLPMNFGEAENKIVIEIEFDNESNRLIKEIPVPVFQNLITIRGDLNTIDSELKLLQKSSEEIWVEVIFTGKELVGDLHTVLQNFAECEKIKILKIQNKNVLNYISSLDTTKQSLEDLTPSEVFDKCLTAAEIPNDQIEELKFCFNEIYKQMQETDSKAE